MPSTTVVIPRDFLVTQGWNVLNQEDIVVAIEWHWYRLVLIPVDGESLLLK